MEWRPLHVIMDIRAKNPPFYKRLLHDMIFEVRGDREGAMINTSKRAIFDRFCLAQGYHLAVGHNGHCFLNPFNRTNSNDMGSEKKFVLRMFDLSTDDQKKSCEGRACQQRLM